MSALAGLTEKSSYDGVPFWVRNPQGKTMPRFGSVGAFYERTAPYSFPANTSIVSVNTGTLDSISIEIAIRGSNLAALRSKLLAGMKSLTFAGEAAQTAILVKITDVRALTSHGLIFCKVEWRGRP